MPSTEVEPKSEGDDKPGVSEYVDGGDEAVKGDESDKKSDKKFEGSSVLTYVFIGLFVVGLVMLLYYAYNRFVDNSIQKSMDTKKKTNDRQDAQVADFNLQDTINKLNGMQNKVLKRLTSDVGI